MVEGILNTLTELGKIIFFQVVDWSHRVFAGFQIGNIWLLALDIILTSFLIYWFLKKISESRAIRILYGIITLVTLFLIGHFLNLLTLNWLIKYITIMLIVAIVVIFQPELREALESLGKWGKSVPEDKKNKISFSKRLKILFTQNLGLKFLSLVIASGLWLFAATVENRTDFLPGTILVEAENLAPTLAPVFDQDEIKVKISASNSIWKKLTLDDFQAVVDLEKFGLGTNEVDVKVTCSVPGVQIISLEPEKIRVRIEPAVTAQVNVVAKFEGSLASGYQVIETQIEPDSVEAKGAKGVIEKIIYATAVVQLQGQDRDIRQKIKLTALDEFDKPIKSVIFTPERVEVKAIVAKEGGGKLIGVKPKIEGIPASGFWISKIEFEPVAVRILGSEDKLDKLDYLETQEINISGLNQNRVFEKEIIIPSGLSLEKGSSKNIEISIFVSPNPQSREVNSSFSFSGLGGGLTVTQINPQAIKVMVTGTSAILASLSSDNVVVNLNLSGRGVGNHLIGISRDMISVPSGAAISSFIPNNVTIKIE